MPEAIGKTDPVCRPSLGLLLCCGDDRKHLANDLGHNQPAYNRISRQKPAGVRQALIDQDARPHRLVAGVDPPELLLQVGWD